MKEFVVGKEYRCIGDDELKGTIFECIESDITYAVLRCSKRDARINMDNAGKRGWWQVENFEEVKEMKTRTDFRVGDRVYCIYYGWGVVTAIDSVKNYAVNVTFDDKSREAYTKEGKLNMADTKRKLFFAEPKITPECLEKEEDFHIITIDGKEVKLSEESFQALREHFK